MVNVKMLVVVVLVALLLAFANITTGGASTGSGRLETFSSDEPGGGTDRGPPPAKSVDPLVIEIAGGDGSSGSGGTIGGGMGMGGPPAKQGEVSPSHCVAGGNGFGPPPNKHDAVAPSATLADGPGGGTDLGPPVGKSFDPLPSHFFLAGGDGANVGGGVSGGAPPA